MKIFITGKPGVGKTTLFLQIVEELKKRGVKIIGFTTPEVREGNKRIGFKCKDLNSSKEIWLAKVGKYKGKKIGKYTVFVDDFERFFEEIFEDIGEADVIAIDEMGKMEFFSPKFKQFVFELVRSDKKLLAVLHRNFVKDFKNYGKVFWLTREKFDKIRSEILSLLAKH